MQLRFNFFQDLSNIWHLPYVRLWQLIPIIILIGPGCGFQEPVQHQITHVPTSSAGTEFTITPTFVPFLEKYGGIDSLGYPLTNVITVDGWKVQYFQFARLEFHPENEPDYIVTVGWLGELLQRRQPPISPLRIPPQNDTYRRYYAQTGHTLSGDFLTYFDTYGGSVRFGLPISEPFLWQGRLTQDFQSARFFWTPDQPVPVTLEAIGQVHLEQLTLLKK